MLLLPFQRWSDNATGVVVTDALPTGYTFVSATSAEVVRFYMDYRKFS
jgi:hypothetical protein